jgi:hypothetical protein
MRYAALWARGWSVVVALGVGLALVTWGAGTVVGVLLTGTVCGAVLVALSGPSATVRNPHGVFRWMWVVTRALLVGAAVLALCAYASVVPYLVVPLVLLAAVTSPWVLDRLRTLGRGEPEPAPTPVDDLPAVSRLATSYVECDPASARALTDEELCRQWRRSYVLLRYAVTDEEALQVVAMRQAYLDELEARRPDALQAWLASGARAAGGPDRYLRVDPLPGQSDAA